MASLIIVADERRYVFKTKDNFAVDAWSKRIRKIVSSPDLCTFTNNHT